MGREQSGRGGLSPAVFHHALALELREERLPATAIAARTGITPRTVRCIRRALAMLREVPSPPLEQVARRTQLGLKTVRLLAAAMGQTS